MKRTDYSRDERAVIEEGPTPEGFRLLRKTVYRHYRDNGRDLPWRKTREPYQILLSEVMLQQTQVDRVLQKYERFIEAFPDFPSLAGASLRDILYLWQGLGYNRRAVALKTISETVVLRHNGEIPPRLNDLVALPGIGHATACAVLAFAFNRPVVFIETNIRRVFIHFFFRGRERIRDAEILPLVDETLDRINPREWYYALMDYGAMLKKQVPNPNKKSAHYQRHPPFEGSSRQLRGRVLKVLLSRPNVTEEEMGSTLKVELRRIRECLDELEKEGFAMKRGKKYSIP